MSRRGGRVAAFAGATVLLLTGCRDERTLRAGTETDAHAAVQMLRRMGQQADVATRPAGSVRVPGAQAEAAEALLADTGFAHALTPAAAPLVAGPTESARHAREVSGRTLQAALRALPDILNAQVVDGPAGAAVFVWHPAARPPGAAVTEATRAVFGPHVQVVATPVAPRTGPSVVPRSLEVPLALATLMLAAALAVVAWRQRRGAAV
jgi:hypothetical protein